MSSTTGPGGSQNAHASQQLGSAPATTGTGKAAVKPIESLKMKIIDEVADGVSPAQGGDSNEAQTPIDEAVTPDSKDNDKMTLKQRAAKGKKVKPQHLSKMTKEE